jgi:hypothetical protein
MPRIVLQAGSTFWFEYGSSSRWVFAGQTFEIDQADFALFEAVAKEIVEGSLPNNPRKFTERMVTKAREAVSTVVDAVSGATAGKFPCPHCGLTFKAAKGLEIHTKNAHPASEPSGE